MNLPKLFLIACLALVSVRAAAEPSCSNFSIFEENFASASMTDRTHPKAYESALFVKALPALRRRAAARVGHMCLPSEARLFTTAQMYLTAMADERTSDDPAAKDPAAGFANDSQKLTSAVAGLKAHELDPKRALELKPILNLLGLGAKGEPHVTLECFTGFTKLTNGEGSAGTPVSYAKSVRCEAEYRAPIPEGTSCGAIRQRVNTATIIYLPPNEMFPDGIIEYLNYDSRISQPDCEGNA